jgi:hypothetical protein
LVSKAQRHRCRAERAEKPSGREAK